MLSKTLVLMSSLGLGMLSLNPVNPPKSQQHADLANWHEVRPGVMARSGKNNLGTFVEYRAKGDAGTRELVRIMADSHHEAAYFLAKSMTRPRLVMVSSGTCSGSAFATAGTAFAQARVTVSCTDSSMISGGIDLYAPWGTEDSEGFTATGSGTLNVRLSNPDAADCAGGNDCPFDPDSWTADEYWSASSGDTGYYQQCGPNAYCGG